jgi:SIR2-like domain
MNNLTTTISFSIHSNKGIYALLLGSGISRPSGIPTGWDIVLDLIQKLAVLKKDDCKPDPITWFKNKYNEDPDYSNILSKLVATPSERINLLKPYIEPTQEDQEQGLKLPTIAHTSIANLVKKGYIKLIITTNFDRLLEHALQSMGIEPIVIRHAEDIDGTMPLEHSPFTLIKINGDYLDNRFLNTKKELARYDQKMHDYLLQVINNYGIIECGWSAKWDYGLMNIIKQSQNFRFSSYWTYKDTCEPELKEIANRRKGEIIEIRDADSFFSEISEKVDALESFNDRNPLSAEIAIARLKKYIVKEESKILLNDLFVTERKNSISNIKQFEKFDLKPAKAHIMPQIRKYETSIDTLLKLALEGVLWSRNEHITIFQELLIRISSPIPDDQRAGFEVFHDLHYYPSLLLLYVCGLSAVKTRKFDLLNAMFKLKISERESQHSERLPLIKKVNSFLLKPELVNEILGKNYKTPLSTYVNQVIRRYFLESMPLDQEYNDIFDIFEYLVGLNFLNLTNYSGAPYGQFKWRIDSHYKKENSLFHEFFEEESQMSEWGLLKSGMFGGKFETYTEVKTKFETYLNSFYLH